MKRINCTLADIAKKTGLSTATVSLALRNNARISKSTKTVVKKTAKDMGYRPDPLLSALVARRNKNQPHRTYSNLGVIIDENWSLLPDKGEWVDRVVRGMKGTAHQLGYDLDVLYLRKDLGNVGSPDRFLEARGIRGLVLPSLFEVGQYLTLDWNRYAIVVLGSHPTWPDFHRIATDFFAGMDTLVSKLHALGYRRIGMAHSYSMEKTHRFEWLGAYLKEAHQQPPASNRSPPTCRKNSPQRDFSNGSTNPSPTA